jgi:3-hydroxyacyl-[acyl-carrier-protein] dehydratase
MWIDRVIELVPGQKLVAVKNVSLAEEHLHQHFGAEPGAGGGPGLGAMPVMPACFILEGMAQSGGVLVGHAEGFAYNVVLAKINRAELVREATPGCTLRYTAVIERMDELGAAVRGTVDVLDHARAHTHAGPVASAWEHLGSVELMFSHLDNSQGGAGRAGSDFPAHNFVFGEGFKTLLRSSGF